jgi:hypothetical protein
MDISKPLREGRHERNGQGGEEGRGEMQRSGE